MPELRIIDVGELSLRCALEGPEPGTAPLAIFVHGCFWHGHDCPRGARMPASNRDYWLAKIGRNVARDNRHLKHNAGLRLLQTVTFFSFGFLMLRLGRSMDYIGLFIWGFLTLILFFSEKRVFKDTLLQLTDKGILIPGTYREYLVDWGTLEDVVVRHDFVTLFHRGKKFLQYQVLQDLSELELVKMNAFCREKIDRQATAAKAEAGGSEK